LALERASTDPCVDWPVHATCLYWAKSKTSSLSETNQELML